MIAFDVGTRSVRAVWVGLRGGRPAVTRAETFALPMDEEDPHKLIGAWVHKLGLAKQFCAVALPGSQTVFQSGRIMPNDPRTPEQVAAMDIAQFSEMAGDDMAYDVFAFETPFEAGVRRYIMSMARPSSIKEVVQATRRNSLRPADLISAPVALYNAMETFAGEREEPYCYVSIGHTQTEVAIGLNSGLLFARSLAAGGKLFTDAVAQTTGLPAVQAEVRKHVDCGLRENDACCEPLRLAADRWISQFNACMGVYRSTFQDRKFTVARIVITGGGAQLKGLKEYLAAKLFLPVQHVSELPSIDKSYQQYAGVYDMAFGLAITAMGQGTTTLSLLPQDLKDEVVFRAQKPWWIAAVFLTATMALYSATGVYLLRRDGALLDASASNSGGASRSTNASRNCAPVQPSSLTRCWSRRYLNGPLARKVLTLVAHTVDPEDWITMFCDENIYNPTEQDTTAKPDTPQTAARNRSRYSVPASGRQQPPRR